MAPRLLHGLETEYAFSQFREDGEVLERRNGLRRLLVAARKRLECLPDATSAGLFLGNGSRLYLDAGNHPELSTPECTDPWQLVRYLKAGEAILIDLAQDLDVSGVRRNQTRTSFFRSNVDYHSFVTWGCHESYQYHDRAEAMSLELIPHFVSRIIYTGAGGFDDQSPGLEFVVSPRVAHLERVSSADSTSRRGIFHTKDEPLSHGGGWHRLHVLCGESLCGEVGSFLKVEFTIYFFASSCKPMTQDSAGTEANEGRQNRRNRLRIARKRISQCFQPCFRLRHWTRSVRHIRLCRR